MSSEKLTFDALKYDVTETLRKKLGNNAPGIIEKRLSKNISADDFLRLSFDNLLANLAIAECVMAMRFNEDQRVSNALSEINNITKMQLDNLQSVTQRLMGDLDDVSEGDDSE